MYVYLLAFFHRPSVVTALCGWCWFCPLFLGFEVTYVTMRAGIIKLGFYLLPNFTERARVIYERSYFGVWRRSFVAGCEC